MKIVPDQPTTLAGSLGRLAGSRAARQKLGHALWSAGATTLRSVFRVLHVLFLETTGLLFIALALVGGGAAVREYYKYKAGAIGPGKPILAACFALMFLWFGVTSFWRARRRSRTS